MPLKYGLVKNTLKTKAGKYLAAPRDNESCNIDQVIEMMIQKGSTVTKAEALAVIEEYHQAIESLVTEGYRVNTELFSISSSIAGNFNSEDEPFNTNRHSIKINLKAGPRLTACISKIKVKQCSINPRQPAISYITDLIKHTKSTCFLAGQIISIKGRLLKFDAQDTNQGVFIINNTGTEYRASNLIKNMPSELMLFIPDHIPAGDYHLEVRTIVYRSKVVRKTSYPITLR